METVVCVLAHGEADVVDASTHSRIYKAVRRLEVLKEEGASKLVLVCMAGVGKKYSEITLASKMAKTARDELRSSGLNQSVHLIYNVNERKVWGSALEMRWAHEQIVRQYPRARVEFVTNVRHARRVRITSRVLGQGPCEIVTSWDPVSPFHHEILAYLKLGAYVLGLGEWAEARRRRYSGG